MGTVGPAHPHGRARSFRQPTHCSRGLYISALQFAERATALLLPPEASHPTEALKFAVKQLPRQGEAIALLRTSLTVSSSIPTSDTKALSQRFWSELVHLNSKQGLLSRCSARDQLRLRCSTEPLAGAWLTPTPCPSLGLTFSRLSSPPSFVGASAFPYYRANLLRFPLTCAPNAENA